MKNKRETGVMPDTICEKLNTVLLGEGYSIHKAEKSFYSWSYGTVTTLEYMRDEHEKVLLTVHGNEGFFKKDQLPGLY